MSDDGSGAAGDPRDDATVPGPAAARLETEIPGSIRRGATFGRYVVLERIGAGGMGVVWAAYDPELDRRVALKLLLPGTGGSLGRQRLLREAQAMARLAHPNVVVVHDVGEVSGQPYVAMELVDGASLDSWLETAGHGWRERLGMLLAAGRGLAAAHRAGLIHRDFKPANVLVGRDGRVRVTDFGLARPAGGKAPDPVHDGAVTLVREAAPARGSSPALHAALTLEGSLVGTPRYMAPEQVVERRADALSDQFAFAVATYEALYRRHPFGDGADQLRRLVAGEVEPAPPLPGVPGRVRRALLRALAPDPAQRFPSMDELLTELAYDPVARRRRWVVAAVAGVAVLAGGLATLQLVERRRERCATGVGRWAEVWDVTRRDRVADRFSASGAPFAGEASAQVAAAFTAYGARWAAAWQEICRSTYRQGEQSELMLDRRLACLDQRRREADSLLRLLEEAGAELVARADEAVGGLRPVEECLDAASFLTEVPLPSDPALRAGVAGEEERLATAYALLLAGDYPAGQALAADVAAAAEALAYPPLLADALRTLGHLGIELGEPAAAQEALTGSVVAAERGGSDGRAMNAAVELVWLHVLLTSDLAAARQWSELAAAKLARLGSGDARGRELLAAQAALAEAEGRYDEAVALHREALALIEAAEGPDGMDAASAHNQLGNACQGVGDYEAALVHYQRSAELKERHLGPHHPSLGTTLANLGGALGAVGRREEALATLERALGVLEAAFGRDSPNLATVLNNLAFAQESLGRFDDALPVHDRALGLVRGAFGSDHPQLAYSLLNRASVQRRIGRLDAALADAREAQRILDGALGPDHPTSAYATNAIGVVLLLQGRAAAALPYLERAVAVRAAAAVDPVVLAQTRFSLAKAVWETGEPGRARALAHTAARDLAAAGERGQEDLELITAWLQEHP